MRRQREEGRRAARRFFVRIEHRNASPDGKDDSLTNLERRKVLLRELTDHFRVRPFRKCLDQTQWPIGKMSPEFRPRNACFVGRAREHRVRETVKWDMNKGCGENAVFGVGGGARSPALGLA